MKKYTKLTFCSFSQCGADYVKINQTVPIGTPATEPYTRCASIDGDADRVVYFFTDANNQFYLLDGDRIATLYAGYVDLNLLNVNLIQSTFFAYNNYI